jgi:hypothetical protein
VSVDPLVPVMPAETLEVMPLPVAEEPVELVTLDVPT